MKKYRITVFVLVLCLLLCGCGGVERLPYLSEEERAQIQQQLMENLSVSPGDTDTSVEMTLCGVDNVDLHDVIIFRSDSGQSLVQEIFLPKGKELRDSFSMVNNEISFEELVQIPVYIRYTIGAYTYNTDEFLLPVKALSAGMPEIYLETESGRLHLSLTEVTRLGEKQQPYGLKGIRIDSLTPSYSSFSLNFEIGISGISDMNLVYKLYDENDVVCGSDTVFFMDGKYTMYYFDSLPAGEYTLVFEQFD